MIAYQKITLMKDSQKNKVVVENASNTFEFYDCTMAEIAEFMGMFFHAEGED